MIRFESKLLESLHWPVPVRFFVGEIVINSHISAVSSGNVCEIFIEIKRVERVILAFVIYQFVNTAFESFTIALGK